MKWDQPLTAKQFLILFWGSLIVAAGLGLSAWLIVFDRPVTDGIPSASAAAAAAEAEMRERRENVRATEHLRQRTMHH